VLAGKTHHRGLGRGRLLGNQAEALKENAKLGGKDNERVQNVHRVRELKCCSGERGLGGPGGSQIKLWREMRGKGNGQGKRVEDSVL